jgi:hypothetical protein
MATKFEQLKTLLTDFNKEVVGPASKQRGRKEGFWEATQREINGFYSILQGYVNTLEQKNWSKDAGPIREASGIKNIVDYLKRTNLAENAAKYEKEHGEGGAKKRSVFGVKDEEKRVKLCKLFQERIGKAKTLVQGWKDLKQ